MSINFRSAYARLGAVAVGASLATLPMAAHAAVGALTPAGGDINTSSTLDEQISSISGSVIDTVLLIAGVLAVIYLLYSGIQYITSAGNPEKAKGARQGIINAVIGIVVIIAAFFIVRLAVGSGNQINSLNN